ncbi:GAF and ANTAR domain-containing protein [Streptomonospora wellingtoniae]|uniref:GAF and ANTAR domain-containing protein n=1 Tax=Streptomonospora wellingtoniae TaxID=3075544 RepID=A0ABU2KTD5_9ACTN|nr:GAF and ANTAR domain-containing protein [Streptomonospora sp. DSM 45055]MDT0302549.1 GAF and ANTAR domain-containing protein [Streptomonospora sp. DSM 45055]
MLNKDHSPSPRGFAEVVRSLFVQPDLRATLQRTVDLAVTTVPGCDYAGVSLVESRSRLQTPVCTHDIVRRSDALQLQLGEGPSLDSMGKGTYVYLPDLTSSTRWPRYAAEAAKLPIGSLLSFRLFTARETLGVLILYAGRPQSFGEDSHEVGVVYSAQAASALAANRHISNLSRALDTRETIGQAQGILMERHHMTADQAWERLREASQNLNVKLAELAEKIALTGEDPTSPVN